MASFHKLVSLMLIVSLVLLVGAPKAATAAITCNQVVSNLTPCINYVLYGGTVPGQCCNGIQTLYAAAQTTPDRQAVCKCLKSAINMAGGTYNGRNIGLAAGLPSKCNVNVPYKIDPSTNCDQVQ